MAEYVCPQTYSTEPAGEVFFDPIPEKKKKREYLAVYYNGTEVKLAKHPVQDNDTFYVMPGPVFKAAGLDAVIDGDMLEITGKTKARFVAGSKVGSKNGEKVVLNNPPMFINKTFMVPLNLINCVLDAKVWLDPYGKMIVITTGEQKNDRRLRIIGGKFYMNGEPYYEISFNKWDASLQICSEYIPFREYQNPEHWYPAAEDAFRQLHSLGFNSVRIFMSNPATSGIMTDEKKKERYYMIMDRLFDLLDKYEIQIVACMSFISGAFVAEGENAWNLVCEKDSESRKNLVKYIGEFVQRYAKRKTILMWESDNENNLGCDIGAQIKRVSFSIRQIGDFYEDIAKEIKKYDDRPFTGGDSIFRNEQWHLYLGVKSGSDEPNWVRDTLEDRLKAYAVLHRGEDVISMHTYSVGCTDDTYSVSDTDDTQVKLDFKLLMSECERMGKPFYNGETAVNADEADKISLQRDIDFLDSMIDAGVQITHWWTFHCDREGFNDGYGWDLTYGPVLDAIVDANRKIKEVYCVNAAEDDNTF